MIRLATEADLEQVLRLERATSTAPHWPYAEYVRLLHPGPVKRALFVAADEVLHGFAVGKLVADEAELESVAVLASVRRRGLGRELCRAVLEWAQGKGAREVQLEVRAGSLCAIRMYEGLGFMLVGRRPRYYADPVEDAILMRCLLEQKTNQDTPCLR